MLWADLRGWGQFAPTQNIYLLISRHGEKLNSYKGSNKQASILSWKIQRRTSVSIHLEREGQGRMWNQHEVPRPAPNWIHWSTLDLLGVELLTLVLGDGLYARAAFWRKVWAYNLIITMTEVAIEGASQKWQFSKAWEPHCHNSTRKRGIVWSKSLHNFIKFLLLF